MTSSRRTSMQPEFCGIERRLDELRERLIRLEPLSQKKRADFDDDPYLRDIFCSPWGKKYFRFAGGKDELGRDLFQSPAAGRASELCGGSEPVGEAKTMKRTRKETAKADKIRSHAEHGSNKKEIFEPRNTQIARKNVSLCYFISSVYSACSVVKFLSG